MAIEISSSMTTTVLGGHDHGGEAAMGLDPGVRELGRYVVLEAIGAGGMGVVVRAYDPKLQREVAIKQLRADALDARASDRMVREAQVMAQLAHPNVVTVHDVEVLESTVLLVMELVEGRTLRRWLSEEQPALPRVLEAFVQAGRGLVVAHDADLVHRDFKPDNVLVGRDGRVRVTDFGLARALREPSEPRPAATRQRSSTDSHASLRVPMTVEGTVVGTPLYMAPEQHFEEDADARADQFSFCVALWEALVGSRPYPASDDRILAQAKLTGPPKWTGDAAVPKEVVDAIERGLAPRPEDRWPSMLPLLAVLDRDRTRNRTRGVAMAAVGVAAVATMSAVYGWQDSRPELCRGAREHLVGVWDEPRREAVAESFRASGVQYAEAAASQVRRRLDPYADTWVQMHTEACEATSVRGEQSAEVLDLRMACLSGARVRLDAVAEVLSDADAGVVERAVALAESVPPLARCAELSRLQAAVDPPESLQQQQRVEQARRTLARAAAQHDVGRHREALAMVDDIEPDALAYPPLAIEAAAAKGRGLLALGRYDDAERVLSESYPLAIGWPRHPASARSLGLLAFVVGARQMREDESRWLATAAVAMAETLDDDRSMAVVLNDRGAVEAAHAHYEEAAESFTRSLEIRTRGDAGTPSLGVADTLSNLEIGARRRGEFDEALRLRHESLAIERELLGREHPDIARSLQALGNLHHLRGEYEESVQVLKQALVLRERLLGVGHRDTAHTMASLGTSLSALGQHADAEQNIRRAHEILEREVGADAVEVTDLLNNLAIAVEAQGRYEESLELHRQSLAAIERMMGSEHPRTAVALNNVGGALVALRREEEALPLLLRSVELMARRPGPEHPNLGIFEFNAGDALLRLGRHDEALPLLRQSLARIESMFGPEHVYASYALVGLGRVLLARGDPGGEALGLLERGYELRLGEHAPAAQRAEAAFALAQALWPQTDQRARARDLAELAQRWWSELPERHEIESAEVSAWLAEHAADAATARRPR
ncbi:MAG: serine/threonine-protein kinase [Myxococcota bacterium]